jgi:signal peptidase I
MSKRKKILAGLLSAMFPGVGHIFVGQLQAGMALIASFLVFVVGSSLTRIWGHYYGLIACEWSAFLFTAISAYAVCFHPREEATPTRLWLLLFIPLAFVSVQLTQVAWWLNGYRLFIVPSTSMQPTIWMGDRVVADFHYFRSRSIERGQIIVFKKEDLYLVKRVEAVPGDVIEGKGGTIYLNGKELAEGFEKPPDYEGAQFLATFGPVRIPAGEYFVLGDNRPVSRDSRAPDYGNIAEDDIGGRVLLVFNPFKHSHDKQLTHTPGW